MDQSTLVDKQINDGRRFVERFAVDGNPVQAAFWVKTAEEGLWFLYVASEVVDLHGSAWAYRAVHASLRKLTDVDVVSSEVKVIGTSNPIAKDVIAIQEKHPGRLATWYGGKKLGSMSVDRVYLYPPHVYKVESRHAMSSEDIGHKVLRLMGRGPGILEPSFVVLKNGDSFRGVPFSIQFGTANAVMVSFVADGEAAPRVLRLDEIASVD